MLLPQCILKSVDEVEDKGTVAGINHFSQHLTDELLVLEKQAVLLELRRNQPDDAEAVLAGRTDLALLLLLAELGLAELGVRIRLADLDVDHVRLVHTVQQVLQDDIVAVGAHELGCKQSFRECTAIEF